MFGREINMSFMSVWKDNVYKSIFPSNTAVELQQQQWCSLPPGGSLKSSTQFVAVRRMSLAKPVSVDGTQVKSITSEAKDWQAVTAFPYLIWKGSSMVKYSPFLIRGARTRPPLE